MNRIAFARLRAAVEQRALQLPGTHRDIKWGSVVVCSVVDKMYCCMSLDSEPEQRLSLKVPVERFLELTDQPGIIPAPYLAKHHWVCLETACMLNQTEVLAMLEDSYRLVRSKLSKKVQSALAQDDPAAGLRRELH